MRARTPNPSGRFNFSVRVYVFSVCFQKNRQNNINFTVREHNFSVRIETTDRIIEIFL